MVTPYTLRKDEVEYELGSVADSAGRILYWNDRVFREVRDADSWSIYAKILKSKICSRLVAGGMVETWIPHDVHLEGSAGLLEHKKIDYVTCPAEWTPRMLWDAARCYGLCGAALAEEHLVFKDCHPWNILFDFCQPALIDFGSIVRESSPSSWIEGLRVFFVLPLWLRKVGRDFGRAVAREMMREHIHGIGYMLVRTRPASYLPPTFYRLARLYQYAIRSNDRSTLGSFFTRLQEYIDTLEPVAPKEEWADYPQQHETATPQLREKQRTVLDILKSLGLKTLLDIGANKGWYAFEAAALGYKVVAFDREEHCVDLMYLRGQAEDSRVLPLHMDFLYPTPQSGVALALKTSFDRLNSDVSLVLGLVHHLALRQGVGFAQIAEIVSRYTRRVAIIEFVPPEDEHIRNWHIPSHYTKRNLVKAMARRGLFLQAERQLRIGRSILVFARNP